MRNDLCDDALNELNWSAIEIVWNQIHKVYTNIRQPFLYWNILQCYSLLEMHLQISINISHVGGHVLQIKIWILDGKNNLQVQKQITDTRNELLVSWIDGASTLFICLIIDDFHTVFVSFHSLFTDWQHRFIPEVCSFYAPYKFPEIPILCSISMFELGFDMIYWGVQVIPIILIDEDQIPRQQY